MLVDVLDKRGEGGLKYDKFRGHTDNSYGLLMAFLGSSETSLSLA
jgi:hypothetical protein